MVQKQTKNKVMNIYGDLYLFYLVLQVIILLIQFVYVEEKVQLIEMLIIIDFQFLLFVKVVLEPN
jgi:hypothetical protein